ncbi:MAG: aminopeptidase P family N-terminal domain-containing protein, partial [Ilumatobacteraceae bacterium]
MTVVDRTALAGGLPALSVAGRDADVRRELARRNDAAGDVVARSLLVFDLNNIRWLTGFTGSAGTLVVHPDEMVLITDGRYGEQARHQL